MSQGSEKGFPLLLPRAAQSLPYIRMRMETEMCTLKSGTGRWNESRALGVEKKKQEGREGEVGRGGFYMWDWPFNFGGEFGETCKQAEM